MGNVFDVIDGYLFIYFEVIVWYFSCVEVLFLLEFIIGMLEGCIIVKVVFCMICVVKFLLVCILLVVDI